ncbi:hypothetical protein AAEX28_10910 [Lentisphaerota bacterium WC36G]|nr:hypothetical protein LJT99_13750 [Lentisphaerae bacterium WC36]
MVLNNFRVFTSKPYSEKLQEKVIQNIIDELEKRNENFKIIRKSDDELEISHEFEWGAILAKRRYLGLNGWRVSLVFLEDYEDNLLVKYGFKSMKNNELKFFLIASILVNIMVFLSVILSDLSPALKSIIIHCGNLFFISFFLILSPWSRIDKLVQRNIDKSI